MAADVPTRRFAIRRRCFGINRNPFVLVTGNEIHPMDTCLPVVAVKVHEHSKLDSPYQFVNAPKKRPMR